MQTSQLNPISVAEPMDVDVLADAFGAESMPLLRAQCPFWVGQQLDPESRAFNAGQYIELKGDLDPEIFEQAVDICLAETELLRLRQFEDDRGVRQYVGKYAGGALQRVDFSNHAEPEASAALWMKEELNRRYDLASGRGYAWSLIHIGPARYYFCQLFHHMVIDGVSMHLITQRLRTIYESLKAGAEPPSITVPSLSSLAEFEAEYRTSSQFKSDREYWMQRLENCPQLTSLSKSRTNTTGWTTRRQTVYLPAETVAGLKAIASRLKMSVNRVMVGSIGIIMHRLTGSADFLVGLVVTGRSPQFRDLPATVVNSLPIRMRIAQDVRVEEAITAAALEMKGALAHQLYRIDDIREDLGVRPTDPHLLGLKINLMPFGSDSHNGLVWTCHNVSVGPVEDLSVSSYDEAEDGSMRIDFDGNCDRFNAGELSEIGRQFRDLLQFIASADQATEVRQVPLLDAEGRRHVIENFNQTKRGFTPRCLADLFDEQVDRTPDQTALIFGEAQLTYEDLDDAANRFARLLIARGAGSEDIVALLVPRGPEMLIALLGIVKAGAAYLPLDTELPSGRLHYMIEDSRASLVVTTVDVRDRHQLTLNASQVLLDAPEVVQELNELSGKRVDKFDRIRPLTPNNLLYTIYTSGSTGMPKGVAVEHRSFSIFMQAARARVTMRPHERSLATATISFDIAGLELFLPLLQGASLVLLNGMDTRDPAAVAAEVVRANVSVLFATPTFWRALLGFEIPRAVRALVGGEALSVDMVPRLLEFSEAFNLYGPTEATVWSSTHRMSAEDLDNGTVITIGGPEADEQFYILDESMSPVPVGVAGELYIAGAGLARGYLNRPELTAEKFLPCPFGEPGERMYRTGDLAQWRENGEVDYLGRTDQQVKIRGLRIELGEIESTFARLVPGIKECAVAPREIQGQTQLVAYHVNVPGYQLLDTAAMRAKLAEALPDYMIPRVFVRLEKMPQTPNQKLDRKALPQPQEHDEQRQFNPPADETERRICNVFAETTGAPRVARDDDFFEIGGHSLAAVLCVHRLRREFNQDVTLRQLFDAPTAESFAKSLSPSHIHRAAQQGAANLDHPTIFLLPGMGGDEPRLVRFRMECDHLARIVALEYPDWTELLDHDGGMDVVMRHLVNQIEKVTPEGPVWLLGYSMGGHCAHALALHFVKTGRPIAFFGLLDTGDLGAAVRHHADQLKVGQTLQMEFGRIAKDVGSLVRAIRQRALDRVLALFIVRRLASPRARRALSLVARYRHTQKLPSRFTYYLHRYFNEVWGVAAVKSWHRRTNEATLPLSVPAFLLRSEAHLPDEPADLGWEHHFPGLSVVDVPGSHETMLDPPHLKTLCDRTRTVIDTLRARPEYNQSESMAS